MIFDNNPLNASWQYDKTDGHWVVDVTAEKVGICKATLLHDKSPRTIVPIVFEVEEGSRGRGVGTRLARATLALAKVYGAKRFEAYIDAPDSMHIWDKLLHGPLSFSRADSFDTSRVPNTASEAIDSIERDLPYADERDIGFVVIASLLELDTKGWELPVETSKPEL
jgi:hypothetical protein